MMGEIIENGYEIYHAISDFSYEKTLSYSGMSNLYLWWLSLESIRIHGAVTVCCSMP